MPPHTPATHLSLVALRTVPPRLRAHRCAHHRIPKVAVQRLRLPQRSCAEKSRAGASDLRLCDDRRVLNELHMRVDVGALSAPGATPSEGRSLVPYIDGASLIDLIEAYEASAEFDVVGGYGGIEPQSFNFGDLRLYYVGRQTAQWPGPGKAWLLGCGCGEVGCWPLEASIDAMSGGVTWSSFRQPHRPDRDYTGFGPFRFNAEQYAAAIDAAVNILGADEEGSLTQ